MVAVNNGYIASNDASGQAIHISLMTSVVAACKEAGTVTIE
jgi:hypothetical protein